MLSTTEFVIATWSKRAIIIAENAKLRRKNLQSQWTVKHKPRALSQGACFNINYTRLHARSHHRCRENQTWTQKFIKTMDREIQVIDPGSMRVLEGHVKDYG